MVHVGFARDLKVTEIANKSCCSWRSENLRFDSTLLTITMLTIPEEQDLNDYLRQATQNMETFIQRQRRG
jgi:hypothetical protein